MRALALLAAATIGLTFSACSTEWVNTQNPRADYAQDYNRCESMVLRDPKLQQGQRLLLQNATERCMQREGWRLVEK